MCPQRTTQPTLGGLADSSEKEAEEQEFQRLLDRFHEGDHSVLPVLWRTWGGRIVSSARRRFIGRGGEYTTSDLGQSVICALLMQAERGAEFGTCPPAFRAYVMATAMNRARRRGRDRSREPDMSQLWRRSGEPDPVSRLEEREEFERVQSRLAVMRHPQNIRFSAEGVPVSVQAELQGTTISAVKNQALRDRRALRSALDADRSDDE